MSTMRHTSTGVNVLRLMQANGTIRAAIGKKDPYAVKSVKLLAQATGEYTKGRTEQGRHPRLDQGCTAAHRCGKDARTLAN